MSNVSTEDKPTSEDRDLSATPFRFVTWNKARKGLWHIAPCYGDDRDKTTLCGKTLKRHAEWAIASCEPDANLCGECWKAMERKLRIVAQRSDDRAAGVVLPWSQHTYGSGSSASVQHLGGIRLAVHWMTGGGYEVRVGEKKLDAAESEIAAKLAAEQYIRDEAAALIAAMEPKAEA